MQFKAVLHPAEEGGYWAEVPVLPGCATQGETIEEVIQNLKEAVLGVLGTNEKIKIEKNAQIMELVL
ncbi:MAG: type II toxin-antitoxin system HicB family antitoxin [Nitrospirota bacterium]